MVPPKVRLVEPYIEEEGATLEIEDGVVGDEKVDEENQYRGRRQRLSLVPKVLTRRW